MHNETDANTKTCGLIGHPLSHTLSPQIHNMLAEMTGINMVYVPFDVQPQHLGNVLPGALALGLLGMNVTIPYKNSIIRELHSIDPLAERIGAVNTLVREKDGNGFRGYNTDMTGLYRSLQQENIAIAGESVIILGAGGVARAVAYLCAVKGAGQIYLLNRTRDKADKIAAEINAGEKRDCVISMQLSDYRDIPEIFGKYLCIQCTSIGMYPREDNAVIADAAFYRKLHTGVDLVYRPFETQFLKHTAQYGAKCVSGLKMLLYQAIDAFELWNQVQITQDQADMVYRKLIRSFSRKGNIVLIGFMGSGKSTVSQILADKLGYTCIDTDVNIEQQAKMTIRDIFASRGEEAFRQMETGSLREFAECGRDRIVLSAGGGLPLREENRTLMHRIGKVIFLHAQPQTVYERLKDDHTRPLLQGENVLEKIENLEKEREKYYQMAADFVITTDQKTPQEVADEIIRYAADIVQGEEV